MLTTVMNEQAPASNGREAGHEAGFESYRAVSRAAIVSLVLGALSLLAWLFPPILLLAAVGLGLGWLGRSSILKYPDELTGLRMASAGMVLCAANFVGATALHAFTYATEVPEGYERISFSELQPNREERQPIPERAIGLHEQKVFVKGYIHPGVASMGPVKEFVLVPDMGTCCFGGQPKMTDMMEVHLTGDQSVRYGTSRRKLAGVFHVAPPRSVGGLQNVVYQLEADQVK